jgi:hypothetical protein
LINLGRFLAILRPVLDNFGQFWSILVGPGQSWLVFAGFDQFWSVLVARFFLLNFTLEYQEDRRARDKEDEFHSL